MEWKTLLSTEKLASEIAEPAVFKDYPINEFEKTTARLSPVLHFADYRIKRKFFLWIKVILSEHDLLIPLKFQRLPGNLAL